jgi:ribonuclease HI
LYIFTDGSCVDNGKHNASAGIGVYFGPNDERIISEKLNDQNPTNNKAEFEAIIRALGIAKGVN